MNLDIQFPLDEGLIYLNHAAVSPWPQEAVDAVTRFAQQNLHRGSWHYPEWLETERELKGQLQQLINAPSCDEIALVKNTSEALSIIAYGLDWQSGDSIVIPVGEFPSNRMVSEYLADKGVRGIQVPLDSNSSPEQALIEAIDASTRLLAVSSVQYHNGFRLNLDVLGQACRDREVLFCVDAIQSLGALAFDVQACQADFVAADGHKWMLGPEGLALLYCRADLLPHLNLHQYGWHMAEDIGNFERQDWLPASSARRFECGSPNMLSIHALNASLALLFAVGIETVEAHILERTRRIQDFLQQNAAEFESLSCTDEQRQSGIVTFKPRRGDVEPLFNALSEHKVFCALRGGGIRLSPHFYTPMDRLEWFFELLLDLVRGGKTQG